MDAKSTAVPPRYVPEWELPPYAFVPGRTPHPRSDRGGHSFGHVEEPISFEPRAWRSCRLYLRALDLFNHGYYWEAHEAWEQLWLACGRRGTTARFLQALIHLAAAGVKAAAGQPAGVASHGRRALEHLRRVAAEMIGISSCLGLRLDDVIALAGQLESQRAAEMTLRLEREDGAPATDA